MGPKDLVITPVFIILFTVVAYFIRPYVTNVRTKKYFLPALWVRFIGAIFIGLLYQFYYSGGDTYYYFYHSGIIHEAFMNDPIKGFALLFKSENAPKMAFEYYSKMFWYHNNSSYMVSRLASFFDLFTLHTYSATALFFSLFSFSGSWFLFNVLTRVYSKNHKVVFLATLFLPSTIIWGSGILKDSLTLGATNWLMGLLLHYAQGGQPNKWFHLMTFISVSLLAIVKIYILILLIIPVSAMFYFRMKNAVRNPLLRLALVPLLVSIIGYVAFYGYRYLIPTDSKYSLANVAETTRITSYDIRYLTGRNAGSGYSFGRLDGKVETMVSLAPRSIIVSLFRPYLWEVRNPLMFLASLEATIIMMITIWGLLRGNFLRNMKDPYLFSCLLFAIFFAFSVGFTYNFGTLMRYRIPMLVFYILPFIMKYEKKNDSRA